eukprot:jgi/Tetstr1/420620/TSEL_011708.t1
MRDAIACSVCLTIDCETAGMYAEDPGFKRCDDMPHRLQDTKLAYAEEPQRAPQGPPHLSIMVKRVRSVVQAWLQSTGPTMELERTCPFRRSVLHELAAGKEQRGKGSFYMEEDAAGEGGTQTALGLVRASAAAVAGVREREAQRCEESIWDAAGSERGPGPQKSKTAARLNKLKELHAQYEELVLTVEAEDSKWRKLYIAPSSANIIYRVAERFGIAMTELADDVGEAEREHKANEHLRENKSRLLAFASLVAA